MPVMPFVHRTDVLACSRSSRVFQHDARTRKARRIHCESLFLVAKWVEGRGNGGGRHGMVGRAPPEVARSISNGRVSERADGEEGGGEGGKTAN